MAGDQPFYPRFQVQQACVVEHVNPMSAPVLYRDQLGIPQRLEMLGDGRAGDGKAIRHLIDSHRRIFELLQQVATGRI